MLWYKIKKMISFFSYFIILKMIPGSKNLRECEKTLSVVFLGALGDFFVFLKTAEQLSKKGWDIILVCRCETGVEEIAKESGFFSKIIIIDNRYLCRIKNLYILHKIKCNYVFAAPISRYVLYDIYSLCVSANIHILPDCEFGCESKKLKHIADKKADMLVPVKGKWEWEKYALFLERGGLVDKYIPPCFAPLDLKNRENMVAIFPGASVKEKCWNVKDFAWVINKIVQYCGCRVLIMGGSSDLVVGKELERELKKIKCTGVELTCAKTNVIQSIVYIKQCRLVISNDSGAAHMGIYCGTPTVVISGWWQYGRFFPNDKLPNYCITVICEDFNKACKLCNKSIPDCKGGKYAAECILAINRNSVFLAAQKLLKENLNGKGRL